MICTELYFSSFLKMICMVRQRRGQPGEGRASRELCTFYTFVLCTALLILHPIMLLLEPICKKLLQKFIYVYVNNTIYKQERKKSAVMHIFFLSCLSSFCFVFILYPLYFEFPVHFPFGVLISFLVHECPDTPAEIRRLQIHPIHPLTWLCHPSLECLYKDNSCVLCSRFGCID